MDNQFTNPFADNTEFSPFSPKTEKSGKGLAIAAMVVGIVAVCSVCCCCSLFFIPLILGLVALGLAIASRVVAKKFHGMALAGLILAIAAILLFACVYGFEAWLNSLTEEDLRNFLGDDVYEAYKDLIEEIENPTQESTTTAPTAKT